MAVKRNRRRGLRNVYTDCNYRVDKELPPHMALAAAIVRQAIADGRRIQNKKSVRFNFGVCVNQQELRQFFRSQWCGTLLCGAVSPEELMEAAGV